MLTEVSMKLIQVPATATATATNISGQSRRQPTPHQLSALAALHRGLQTKKHAGLVLRHNGFSGGEANVEALLQRVISIQRERTDRVRNLVIKRLGTFPQVSGSSVGRRATLSAHGDLAGRLDHLRKDAVKSAARACFRHGAAGGSSMRVELTSDPKAVGYEVVMGSNRDTYRGAYKGWSASEDHHCIRVPKDWRVRVQARGLATAGGMLTLDLQPLTGGGDIELFQAVWTSQARGYRVNVHRGVMARLGQEVFHAEDAQAAVRGVTLKARRAAAPARERVNVFDLSIEGFIERYARYGNIDVSADDARASGACEYGIRSWCNAVGIDLSDERVPLSRILNGFRVQPLIEVRRAVLHAVKAHRRPASIERTL